MTETTSRPRTPASRSWSDLLAEGDAALSAADTRQATVLFEQAFELAAYQGDEQSWGTILLRLGKAYAAGHMWDKAAACYQRAANLAHNLGRKFVAYELQALHGTSEAYQALALATPLGPAQMESYHMAQATAQEMLKLARSVKNGLAECMAWASLGNAQRGLGNYDEAAKSIGYAVAIAQEAKDMAAAAGYLADLAYTELLAGRPQNAEQHYGHGLISLVPPEKYPDLAARLQDGLAEVHLARKRFSIARIHAEEAIRLAQQAADQHLEAGHHSTLGRILTGLGEYEEAAREHRVAINLLQKMEGGRALLDLAGEWGNLADCYRLVGRLQYTLEALQKALSLANQNSDWWSQAKWQDMLGTVYEELDDLDAAAISHRRALQIFLTLGNAGEIAIAYNNLGTNLYRQALREQYQGAEDVQLESRLFAEAEGAFDKARLHARRIGDAGVEANATGNLGLIHLYTGRSGDAVKAFEESYQRLQAAGRHLEAGHQLENLGRAYAEFLGDTDQALDYYDKAVETARRYGDIDGLRIALTRLGDIYRAQRRDTLVAERFYSEAVSLLETGQSGRTALSHSAHRAGLLARNLAAYEGLIQIHWQKGELPAAFDWAERARARVFLEQVGLTALSPVTALPDDLASRERELIRQARELDQRALGTEDPVERAGWSKQRREIQEAIEGLWDEMERLPEGRQYVDLRRGTPATTQSVQSWLDTRQSDTALVAYYNLSDYVYAWVIRSGQPVWGTRISISFTALNAFIDTFTQEVPKFPRYRLQSQIWTEKLSPLVASVRERLDGVQTLYLVPHGRLHDLPLHALPTERGLLVDDFAIAYVPSAGILLRYGLDEPISSGHSARALAFGFTPNEDEATVFAEATGSAADIFSVQPYLGSEATIARLKREAEGAGLLYILCHGVFNRQNALDSYLLLADGHLTAREVMAMNLAGTLVMLIACESGVIEANPGDELSGLSQAFLIAGASAVLATRWTVQATSAIKIVEEFHNRWRRNGHSPATALQQAMRYVRDHNLPDNSRPYAHPYFWAPFILVGNAGSENTRQ